MKTRRIPFIKMHGAGNDFVFLNSQDTQIKVSKKTAELLLDRHFGIGGDQLLHLTPGNSRKSPRLKIYNSDGSPAEMCGNGVRAVAYYLREFKGVNKNFTLITDAGPIGIGLSKGQIDVDMGEPILEGKKIPTKGKGQIINKSLKVKGKTFKIHSVSMGNPHCIVYVKNVKNFSVCEIGPLIEHHSFFPNRVNVEFVQIVNKRHVKARVWERGAGETLACGTGACAIGVAGARFGVTSRNVKIDLPGGQLKVRWAENNRVYLSGPAEVTYKGTFIL